MVIVLAVAAVRAVGGIDADEGETGASIGTRRGSFLSFVPDLHSVWMPADHLSSSTSRVNWWATWYPGAEPGGGGYVAQRMFSAKDERNSLLATLWFNIAHYALRPWPWVLVGDGLGDPLSASAGSRNRLRPRDDRLPAGFAARADGGGVRRRVHVDRRDAAQLGRQLSGQRFLPPLPATATEPDRHYVRASQVATVLLTIISAVVTHYMDSIAGAWKLLIVTGAGTGHGADSALVLVAHQRLERGVRHGRGVRGLGHCCRPCSIWIATIRCGSPTSC